MLCLLILSTSYQQVHIYVGRIAWTRELPSWISQRTRLDPDVYACTQTYRHIFFFSNMICFDLYSMNWDIFGIVRVTLVQLFA